MGPRFVEIDEVRFTSAQGADKGDYGPGENGFRERPSEAERAGKIVDRKRQQHVDSRIGPFSGKPKASAGACGSHPESPHKISHRRPDAPADAFGLPLNGRRVRAMPSCYPFPPYYAKTLG